MDYGKYRYEVSKIRQVSKKKKTRVSVKEVRFRIGTDIDDYYVKLRNLQRFLNEGNKAKVTLRFRRRVMAQKERGLEMLNRVREDLDELATVEQEPKLKGRQMVMVMAPRALSHLRPNVIKDAEVSSSITHYSPVATHQIHAYEMFYIAQHSVNGDTS